LVSPLDGNVCQKQLVVVKHPRYVFFG